MTKTALLFFLFLSALVFSQSNAIDSLKNALKIAKNDTTRCGILNQMIENESDDAVWPSYNNQMKNIAEKNLSTNPKGALKKAFLEYLAAAYNNIGFLLGNEGNLDKGVEAYFKCIKAHSQSHNFVEASLGFVCIGNLYKQAGEYSKAIEFYNKGLDLSKVIKDQQGVANALFFMGDVYDAQGNISESVEFYLRSLKIREEISDLPGTAYCLNNIALIYEKQDEYNEAIIYHQKSLDINNKVGDTYSIATSLNNLGLCYYKQKKLDKAEDLYNKSLELYQKLNDARSMSYVFNNLGNIYQTKNDLEKALAYFNKSLVIRTELGQQGGISQCLISIANIYLIQGKTKEAESTALKALKIGQDIGVPEKIQGAAKILYQLYEKQNKGIEALQMHKLFIGMRDSLKSINTQKALITQNTKYEYEKKAAADSVRVYEEKKVTTAQLKQEKTQRFALYGGILLVGLFGAFMFNRFKVTKKQNHLIHEQKSELQKQKELVEEHQKETLDSIHYAKRIQTALIANSDFVTKHIPNNFIFFKPKDIVSGDFYWATEHHNKFYLAICDSTGHGVPGAFMSLLNIGFLSEAIKEKNIIKPNEIFNYVRERLISTISDGGQKDGMDGILICIDKNLSVRAESRTITYAAANNEPILIRDNEIVELAKDRMPVGKGERNESFKLHTIDLKQGDALYLYSDGYADQFGGPKGKKFKYKPLNELLLNLKNTPLSKQKEVLELTFNNWKGTQEQVDDVLIIGIKM